MFPFFLNSLSKSQLRRLILCPVLAALCATDATAEVLWQQDFSGGSGVEDFGRVDAGKRPPKSAAAIDDNAFDSIAANTNSNVSIVDGALVFEKTASMNNSASVQRTTKLQVPPSRAAFIQFDLNLMELMKNTSVLRFSLGTDFTGGNQPPAGEKGDTAVTFFAVVSTKDTSEGENVWHLRLVNDGIDPDVAAPTSTTISNQSATGSQRVVLICNPTTDPVRYDLGNDVSGTVNPGSYDVWLGGELDKGAAGRKIFDAARPMDNFAFTMVGDSSNEKGKVVLDNISFGVLP